MCGSRCVTQGAARILADVQKLLVDEMDSQASLPSPAQAGSQSSADQAKAIESVNRQSSIERELSAAALVEAPRRAVVYV